MVRVCGKFRIFMLRLLLELTTYTVLTHSMRLPTDIWSRICAFRCPMVVSRLTVYL